MVETQSKLTNPLLAVPLKYALVGGVLAMMLFFALLFFDQNPLVVGKWFDFILLPIFIFFSIKEYKKYYNEGFMYFWQGMTVGFFTYILIAVISAVFVWGYLSFVSPGLVQEYIVNREELIENNKESFITQFDEETYRKTLADIKLVSSADMAWDDFLKKTLIGLFVTSLFSVVMRRRPDKERNSEVQNQ